MQYRDEMCFCLAHAGPLCRLCHHDLNDQPSAEFHKQNDHEDKRRKNTPNRITSYTPAPGATGSQSSVGRGRAAAPLRGLRASSPRPPETHPPHPQFLALPHNLAGVRTLSPVARSAGSRQPDSRAPCRSAWARSTSSRPSLVFRSVELALKTFTFYFTVKRLSSKG